jgi:hypothetical protein
MKYLVILSIILLPVYLVADSLDKEMRAISQKISASLPMRLNGSSTMESLIYINKTLRYIYTYNEFEDITYESIINNKESFIKSQKEQVINGVCSYDWARKQLNKGIKIKYTYLWEDGRYLYDIM